jgi:hypothetical protein
MKTILSQNYFQHEKEIFVQSEGLAMGAPTSSILSEIFLQYLEHNKIYKILVENKIVAYFRYVDDILIIYDALRTNIANVLKIFNSLHPNIKFTSELEQDNKINFLDLTLHRLPTKIFASIYRKPTASGYLIPYESYHPLQHKLAGINYLVNRIVEYPIPESEREKEIRVSQQIANNNGYPHIDIAKLVRDKLKNQNKCENKPETDTIAVTKKWSLLTCIGKEVNPIARTLRKFNVNVAFKSRNTLGKWLKHKQTKFNTDNEKYESCGIYKIKCRSCQNAYIGQTGRSFKTRFKEHASGIANNRSKTGYSHHILNKGHERAHNISELEILEIKQKGPLLNTLEKFHIFKCRKECNLLNEIQSDIHNPIFEVIEQTNQH